MRDINEFVQITNKIVEYMGTSNLILSDFYVLKEEDLNKNIFANINLIRNNSAECKQFERRLKKKNLGHRIKAICIENIENIEDVKKIKQDVFLMSMIKNYKNIVNIVNFVLENMRRSRLFIIKCLKKYNPKNLVKRLNLSKKNIRIHKMNSIPFIFISFGEYFVNGLKTNNRIKIIWDIKYYRNVIFRILKGNESYEKMNYIVKNTSDLEFYLYYHEQYKKASKLEDNKSEYLKKIYDRHIKLIKEIIDLANKDILDIGTEDCYYINLLEKNSNRTVNAINIKNFETYTGDKSCITFYDGVNLPFNANKFDFITIFMTIHHMSNYKETLKNVYNVLKPNGKLLIYEHDFADLITNEFINFYHFLYELILNKSFNISYYNNYDVHYLTKKSLRDNLEQLGFKYVDNNYLNKFNNKTFNPLKKYYSLFTKQ
jgi:SAM-dependent methyltransferase